MNLGLRLDALLGIAHWNHVARLVQGFLLTQDQIRSVS